MATTMKVALDWTPNTNHTGFYVAKAKGFYSHAGLDVSFISPHEDEYKTTPASHLQDGSATFAVTPSETVISYHTWPDGSKPKIVAVAALLQVRLDCATVYHGSAIFSCTALGRALKGKAWAVSFDDQMSLVIFLCWVPHLSYGVHAPG